MDKNGAKLAIDYGSFTHPGGREENEDYLSASVDTETGVCCFVMADGLGGHAGGKNASQLAVESILGSFSRIDREQPGKWLNDSFQEAHNLIKNVGRADSSLRSMRTTCAVVIFLEGKAYWASVGDSRIYVMRDNAILQKSKDHSVVQVLLDMGEIKPEEVLGHPDRNRVLRSLGMDEEMKPAINSAGLPLERGDAFLLCTDGFWDYVSDREIVEFLGQHSRRQETQGMLAELGGRIITTARAHNEHHDNLSAQLIVIR